ncbi:LysR substrate-binding domain-containing protein [Achromobacter xylosoxidans]
MTPFSPDEVIRKLTSRLKMRHLMLLLQIEQHGSLTRVAEHMATSQPAVTNALAELESMFDVPLFERSVRGMTPTPLGAVVLARARALVHDLGHLVQEMEAVAAGHAAHLHIGVIPFVSGQLLSAAIARTMPQGRGITATIHEGQGPVLLRQLHDHTLDVVVGWATPSVDLGQIDFEVLYHQPPRLIASRRLAARLGRTRLEWNMLADLDWILGTPDSPIREQVADIFLRAGLAPPTPSVQSDSSKLIGEMIVASDRAVSILPADIADELVRIAGAAIVPYSFDWTLPPISLFTRADGLRRNVDALFAAALREVFSRNGRA